MSSASRPLRSVLYIPASRTRALEKARDLPADAIIFDLEDAVAPDEKEGARRTLAEALGAGGYGRRLKIVRINGLDTSWGEQDARAAAQTDADAILLPKVNSAADLDRLAGVSRVKPLWAMMETPQGMLNAAEIAAHPQLEGMVMGTNDLARDIGARYRADRLPLMSGLGLCLLAAKAQGRAILDGVYNAFRDEDGLKAECEQGRDMGFDGKTLIHPAQIAVTNDAFSPSPEDVDLATRQIAAYEAAVAKGEAVAVVDGRIVENLHVATARETLAKVEAINSMNAE
ncbi:HpcH/HpaI aldolase/citrate lyase family protein [Roseobacter ponti]|uniref:CoA ester lyase n=1 Tax=Roseobacter ponti TaxID=1891787 RepID=A0A858SU16_9RHOB|nr:CoA ester lyase [Roseobacter ponti]QJF52449.1 CoA ester lyase [Roseobacter ponti]